MDMDFLCNQLYSLLGPMLTCKKGTLDDQLKRTDVDKEFFVLFTVFDENVSWLLDKNIDR